MDTLKILLIATLALLVGALGVSIQRMNEGVAAAPADEVAVLRQQLAEMQQEMQRLQLEKERKMLQEAAAQPAPTDPVTRAEAEQTVADLQARLAELEAEKMEAEEDAERAEAEAGFLTQRYSEDRNRTARRARVINEAMRIASIKEWVDDPNFGGFAVLTIERPENVQVGTVLAIRRNSGVLGRLEISEITAEGAIANPLTAFPEVKPQAGDELILDEVVKLAN